MRSTDSWALKLEPAASYGTGQDPTSIAIGNLNGDDELDVVVTNSTFSEVSVLFGAGNGALVSEYVTGEFPNSTAVGDFNEDGHEDLLVYVGAQAGGQALVFLGRGDGGLRRRTPGLLIEVGQSP